MSSEHFLQSHGPGQSDFHGFGFWGPRAASDDESRAAKAADGGGRKAEAASQGLGFGGSGFRVQGLGFRV